MLKEFLKTSKAYDKRIIDLRIQASTLCLYNLLMTYCALYHEQLNWDFSLIESNYADRIGLQITIPVLTSKFGAITGFLTVLFSSCMWMPIIIPTPEFRNFLIPGIFWNIYSLIDHTYNILEISYDLFALSTQLSVALSLFLTGIFTTAMHGLLLLETILFYDYLSFVPTDPSDTTIWEIEDSFRDKFRTDRFVSNIEDSSSPGSYQENSECGDGPNIEDR